MVGIVVIAHQNLAEELIRSAQHIVGGNEAALAAVAIHPEVSYEEARQRVAAALEEVRDHHGAVILTDMYGGTPANLGMDFLEPGRTELIAGVNLPMLVRLLTYRSKPLEEQLEKAVEGGRQGVVLGRNRPRPHSTWQGQP
ncbi:PTS sugar transporter subunit IIA [Thiohalorhabdus sp.]|uniref:PTS sugar transporter subunit IIA n=1 Tax=Thiohalorhabdus sp. TaxID=3094134 RepID=UPI002FC2A15A